MRERRRETWVPHTQLESACMFGNIARVVHLIATKEKITPRAFILAARNANGALIMAFLLTKATWLNPNANDNQALRDAALFGNTNVVHYLLKLPTVDPGARTNEALHDAVANGHLIIVKLLVRKHIDPMVQANKALRIAIFKQRVKITRFLLKHVDPSYPNDCPILLACTIGNIAIVRMLLQDPRVNPRVYKNKALHDARKLNFDEIVDALIVSSSTKKIQI